MTRAPLHAAVLSPCGKYRYILSRGGWPTRTNRELLIIGLNPSTADARFDDPTIRRCIGFAQKLDYGILHVVNLFAWRATDPRQLRDTSEDPVGPENDRWILGTAQSCDKIVCAWGAGGAFMNRSKAVRKLLSGRDLFAFGVTKSGEPKHPLYLPGGALLFKSAQL